MGRTIAVVGTVALAVAAAVGIIASIVDRRSRSAVLSAASPSSLGS